MQSFIFDIGAMFLKFNSGQYHTFLQEIKCLIKIVSKRK